MGMGTTKLGKALVLGGEGVQSLVGMMAKGKGLTKASFPMIGSIVWGVPRQYC